MLNFNFDHFKVSSFYAAIFCTLRYVLSTEKIMPNVHQKKRDDLENVLISIIHSSLTGPGAVLAIYYEPALLEDLVNVKTTISLSVAQLTFGYFIYDFLDLLRMNNYNISW
jgi:hypothetical protein